MRVYCQAWLLIVHQSLKTVTCWVLQRTSLLVPFEASLLVSCWAQHKASVLCVVGINPSVS